MTSWVQLCIGTFLAFWLGYWISSLHHIRFEQDLVNHNTELLNELFRAVKHIARLSKEKREEGDEWKDL